MARHPKIWTALAPAALGAAAAFLLAFAAPGMTGSGGTAVVIPLTDVGWPQAPPEAAPPEAAVLPTRLAPRHAPRRAPVLGEALAAPDGCCRTAREMAASSGRIGA